MYNSIIKIRAAEFAPKDASLNGQISDVIDMQLNGKKIQEEREIPKKLLLNVASIMPKMRTTTFLSWLRLRKIYNRYLIEIASGKAV